MIRIAVLASAITLVLALPAAADKDDHDDHHGHDHGSHRGAEAHVHGKGEVLVALDGEQLVIELRSPMWNIVGFEHAPKSKGQQRTLDLARRSLEDPTWIIKINPAARCMLTDTDVSIKPAANDKKAHDHHDHDQHDEKHAGHNYRDMTATYTYQCRAATALTGIDFERLFQTFERFESMKGTFLGSKQPVHRTLTGKQADFRLKKQ